mgnify:CR=1 FL=1
MKIICDSPFSPEETTPTSKYYLNYLSVNDWFTKFQPVLERLLDGNIQEWRNFEGDIILKGIKTTGNIKIVYSDNTNSRDRTMIRQIIEEHARLLF